MPSCWFALQRFFLRVDHVLFRLYDVRIFHDFASDRIIRECRGREAPYEQVWAVRSLVTLLSADGHSACRSTSRTI